MEDLVEKTHQDFMQLVEEIHYDPRKMTQNQIDQAQIPLKNLLKNA